MRMMEFAFRMAHSYGSEPSSSASVPARGARPVTPQLALEDDPTRALVVPSQPRRQAWSLHRLSCIGRHLDDVCLQQFYKYCSWAATPSIH